MLRWGGGRDPWRLLAGLLQEPALEGGGERAMEMVGKWGLNGCGHERSGS